MHEVRLDDQVFKVAQRASETGFASVEEYIADVVAQDVADDAEGFDHLFTSQVVRELERISAAAKAGGKTYTSEEVREHFRKKSDAWRANHPE